MIREQLDDIRIDTVPRAACTGQALWGVRRPIPEDSRGYVERLPGFGEVMFVDLSVVTFMVARCVRELSGLSQDAAMKTRKGIRLCVRHT